MKLATIQFAPVLGDLDDTLARLDPLLDQCADADLIVLPELANCGYNFADRSAARAGSESIEGGPFVDHLIRFARAHSCEIITGLCERAGDHLYNSAVLITERGVEGVYRKLHLFMNEFDLFTPGDLGLPVFERPWGVLGMQVCFDWCFPETWRSLALAGADLIAHPSNLVLPEKCLRAIPIHAMINRIFIATANRIGAEGELIFTGRSLIADPQGTVLAEASADKNDVCRVEIDLSAARDKSMTRRNDAFADRRPDQYIRLCDEI